MNTWTCSVSRDDKRADRSAASVVRRRRISEKLLAAVTPAWILGARLGSLSKLPLVVVVTGNFLHEHHDPAPQGGIINSHERSDQP